MSGDLLGAEPPANTILIFSVFFLAFLFVSASALSATELKITLIFEESFILSRLVYLSLQLE